MQKGDCIDAAEIVARAVIFPTHLPAMQLSQESLLTFDAEDDPAAFGGWGHIYTLSVTRLCEVSQDEAHEIGIKLADTQNNHRPLKVSEETKPFGSRRSYLGYYSFSANDVQPSDDNLDELVNLYWPEDDAPHHVNCCIRISGEVTSRNKKERRVRYIGLLWRAICGPVRYLHDGSDTIGKYVNNVPLEPRPST